VTLQRFEVGLVSADRVLVDFLAGVFELGEEPPLETPGGVLHRLASPGAVLKVMVPEQRPAEAQDAPFVATEGMRYLTMWVTDLDAVVARATARGATVMTEPFEYQPGMRVAILAGPQRLTLEIVEGEG